MKHLFPLVSVESICERISVGIVIKPSQWYADSGIRCFRSQNVRENKINDSGWVYITPEGHKEHSKSTIKTGDVLIVRTGAPGTACVVPKEYEGSNCIDIIIARPRIKCVVPEFLSEFINSDFAKSQIRFLQGGMAQQHLNVGAVCEMEIPLPPIEEQREISRSILFWDTALEALCKSIEAQKTRRQGLMQQLLTGKRRFPGFTKPWRKRTIGDVAEASSVRNKGRLGSESVRAVNKAEGMIPMKEHVMADDLSRYQVVKKHWFAYNPMRINIGSICQWLGQEDALVSPDYVVFRCRDEVIDHRYFNAFRRSDAWSSFMDTAGAGGVRIRIYFDDLAQLPIPLPELDEQRRIADLFDVVDREIELLERLLAAYRAQKKGLMQQLLTGKRRVKVQAA